MKAKRAHLPKDFEDLLASGDLPALQAVYERRALDATDKLLHRTALAFDDCPDELARWLVGQGLDVDTHDRYSRTALYHRRRRAGIEVLTELGADVAVRDTEGATPLHCAAGHGRVEAVDALLRAGADPHATDRQGRTPLGNALARCRNADIAYVAPLARLLVEAGAVVDEGMRARVREMGETFEFFRTSFNPDSLDEADAALRDLYALLGVPPVAALHKHDGRSRIEVTATRWNEQFDELWGLLVPGSGAAATSQGEAVRICGRLADEILRNGGANWDGDHRQMCDALVVHVRSGTALPPAELDDATRLASTVRTGDADTTDLGRLTELTVRWVLLNPEPVPLATPVYRR
ncbi:ankyrin repeat domain-containing protein [Cellulomonas sp. URHB0016]